MRGFFIFKLLLITTSNTSLMSKQLLFISTAIIIFLFSFSACNSGKNEALTAQEILGNPNYPAISYGGYRNHNRADAPSVADIKEDLAIMHAAGFRVLRTYHARLYNHTPNLLKAISEMKESDPSFEMYVMLGAWIQCANAWSDSPNHSLGDTLNNRAEIDSAIAMAQAYPDIVKVIAVGNESMVHWASGYYVTPKIVLKWVQLLQNLKNDGSLPQELWITSSDNFASWGGGEDYYKTTELEELINTVDYVSMHTYPFHDTHYNPEFWYVPKAEEKLGKLAQIESAMKRALNHSKDQYWRVKSYLEELGVDKPIHIGETGWASVATDLYGDEGSKAADEHKQKIYYENMREWTDSLGISCFYFEAFDEPWKDQGNAYGSENHFGLFTVDGKAKHALWPMVDAGNFEGLSRGGSNIIKTMKGNELYLQLKTQRPPYRSQASRNTIATTAQNRKPGEPVTEQKLILVTDEEENDLNDYAYPSAKVKLNSWDGTCGISLNADNIIEINTGSGDWWGCALELDADGKGENLQDFAEGFIHFDVKGNTNATVQIGFQSGVWAVGNQVNAHTVFAPNTSRTITSSWQSFEIPVNKISGKADLQNVTSLLYILGTANNDGKEIQLRNVYWSKN
jgi:exo-beta-1,3-glucanase (GH17 family)